MYKVLTIARREYLAAVRSRYFVISITLVFLFTGGGMLLGKLAGKQKETREQKFAIIDRSPGEEYFKLLDTAVQKRNASELVDAKTSEQTKPAFRLEKTAPAASESAALQQRFELSERVRKSDLRGFLEIGPEEGKPALVFYSDADSLSPRLDSFSRWAERIINQNIQLKRFSDAGVNVQQLQAIIEPVPLRSKLLTERNAKTGQLEESSEGTGLAMHIVPMMLVMVMYMVILLCSSLMLQAVLEEKMQRIYEVLLGSVTPFELMMGKLVGMTGVSLTLTAVYMASGWWVARWYGVAELMPLAIMPWVAVFLILGLFLYGSLCLALGSACSDLKEAQTMMTPIALLAVLPMFFLPFIQDEPNGALAVAMSLFPPATPMLMVARQVAPAGIPWWQPLLGVLIMTATTLACVWAAGRIFRVGILVQGKGAKMREMLQWMVQG